ncbi:type I DNA topoisomerase [Candidatus Curtissbacteria bacterium]|nr:type I DNA topoisomerase [Candidatus Curtissbacteria bacterium]
MKNLVIVESPTKARTLAQFLGSEYQITASMGHVRDLPRGEFGVDVERGFEPIYVIPKEKIKSINILAKEAAQAEQVWLATDPDREGEAIAWNLLQIIKEKGKIKKPNYERVVFHEITRDAVMEAFGHPRKIDDDLVEAQQARRVLDRIVGYKLSPLLWKKVKSGLSAGRVQSVALRLVVDREREIEAFVPEEYWMISADLESQDSSTSEVKAPDTSEVVKVFVATLIQINGKKAEVKNKDQADKIVADLEKSAYRVLDVKTKDAKKYPSPPFTTSTLQQVAASKLGYAPKRTMRLAQDLYENGLITYMRTDSVNLSPQAVESARKFILEKFGKNYLPASPRAYKAKSRLAQEAHEAIRPTNVQLTTDNLQLTNEHKKLYKLIWRRMVACQMAEAVVCETQVDVNAKKDTSEVKIPHTSEVKEAESGDYTLRASGQEIKFDGWYRAYEKPPIKEQVLPMLSKDEALDLKKVNSEQKFTEPPPRYTEATLIRDLEKNDIGRPSTYAPTISTLYDRAYIERMEGRKIAPTPIGKTTVDFLVKYFGEIVDLTFTADMEDDLDEIAQGKEESEVTIKKFWDPFNKQVTKVTEEAEKMKVQPEETDEKCDKCGRPMVIRYGRFGKFLACSGFPECKNTKTLAAPTGLTCPMCGGNIVMKKTRRGKTFWGCENWPKCKYASWNKPVTAESTENKTENTVGKKAATTVNTEEKTEDTEV